MKVFDLNGALLYEDEQSLEGACLKSVDLTCADFEKKEMTGVDLGGATLSGASFDSSVLHNANLQGAVFEGGFLSDCRLDNATMSGVDCYEVYAYGASFRGADLRNGKFLGCNFDNTDFTNSNLEGAFFGPDNILYKTTVCGANLSDAHLAGVRFKDVVYDDATKFPVGFSPDTNGLIKE
jgi:uncharacterized protein YjbI with pentapeptide repeats